jgi:hypothetical protein
MEKQTALTWFYLELQDKFPTEVYKMYNSNQLLFESLYLKAKAMGKEQMIDFAKQWEARKHDGNLDSMEMLYNETYNK